MIFHCEGAPRKPPAKSNLSWPPGKACCHPSTPPACSGIFAYSHLCFPKCGRYRWVNSSRFHLTLLSSRMGSWPPFEGTNWDSRRGCKSSTRTACHLCMSSWSRLSCCLLDRSMSHGHGSTVQANLFRRPASFAVIVTKALCQWCGQRNFLTNLSRTTSCGGLSCNKSDR